MIDLLAKGFPRRSREYWRKALDRLANHPTPSEYPKYGYLLEADAHIAGVILLIFTADNDRNECARCNVSSWYVDPPFRTYATFLALQALKFKNVTYLNISPATHVQTIIEAQGFSRYCDGQVVALPIFGTAPPNARVFSAKSSPAVPFQAFEHDLLLSHMRYGCISVWCTTPREAYPFVFARRLVKGFIPCAQLVYCHHIDDFVRFAKALGRYLMCRGLPFVIVDANGQIAGLPGAYVARASPKYFRGPHKPRLGDLSYTEAALFGV